LKSARSIAFGVYKVSTFSMSLETTTTTTTTTTTEKEVVKVFSLLSPPPSQVNPVTYNEFS